MDPRHGYYQAREEAEKSESSCYSCLVLGVFILSFILIFCLVLGILGLGIAEIVMGAIYFHDCELQPLLPIFLIVHACTGVLLPCGNRQSDQEQTDLIDFIIKCSCSLILGLFHLAWLIAGTVWVLNVRDVIYAPGHCQNNTMTTPPILTTLPTNMISTNETATTSHLLSTLGVGQSSTSMGTAAVVGQDQEKCETCNEALTDFTLVVVAIYWSFWALMALVLILSCVKFCFIKFKLRG